MDQEPRDRVVRSGRKRVLHGYFFFFMRADFEKFEEKYLTRNAPNTGRIVSVMSACRRAKYMLKSSSKYH